MEGLISPIDNLMGIVWFVGSPLSSARGFHAAPGKSAILGDWVWHGGKTGPAPFTHTHSVQENSILTGFVLDYQIIFL